MKVILEFNDYDEEKEDIQLMLKAREIAAVLHDHDQFLRNTIKYATEQMSEDTIKAFEEARNNLRELCNQYESDFFI